MVRKHSFQNKTTCFVGKEGVSFILKAAPLLWCLLLGQCKPRLTFGRLALRKNARLLQKNYWKTLEKCNFWKKVHLSNTLYIKLLRQKCNLCNFLLFEIFPEIKPWPKGGIRKSLIYISPLAQPAIIKIMIIKSLIIIAMPVFPCLYLKFSIGRSVCWFVMRWFLVVSCFSLFLSFP